MRNDQLVKILVCALLSLAMTCTWAVGQNTPPNTSNSQQPAGQPGPRGPSPAPQPGLHDDPPVTAGNINSGFLSKAIEINEAEVQLGQLASTKAQSPDVKSYAQMLVKDHTAGLQKLQKLDGKKGTPALSSEHQSLKTKLSGMTGSQFDHAYIDAMVNGHRDAVKLFNDEISTGLSRPQPASKPAETDVVAAAKEMLPTIQHHLDEGERLQKTLK